jgi:cyclic-di-GMP-binding biofilm dispersal mediator protein
MHDRQSVLVTGATGVLGQGIAELLRPTARLTVTGRDRGRLEAVAAPTDLAVAADLARPAAATELIDAAVAAHGGLDGIVVASGVVAFGTVQDTPDDVSIRLFTVNALAPMRLLRAAIPALRASAEAGRNPYFCAISAVVAEHPVAGMAAYSASKAALSAHLAAARRELRRQRIRVIDVRPPHTETGLADRAIAGTAPQLPTGLDPAAVSARVVAAIRDGETEVAAAQFASA